MATCKALNPLLRAERAALRNAIGRCHNPKHQSYYNYGKRGIAVCEEWRSAGGFDNFIAHIGPKPHAKLSLDRIDNDRGYEPGNVRWVDRATQQSNRRKNTGLGFDSKLHVTHQGRSQSWKDWANELDLQIAAVRQRVARGLPIEEVLAPRQRKSHRTVLVNGEQRDLVAWCKEVGRNYSQTVHRLKNDETPDEIAKYDRKSRNPDRARGTRYELNGESHTIREWSEILNCNGEALRRHLNRHGTMAEALKSMSINITVH